MILFYLIASALQLSQMVLNLVLTGAVIYGAALAGRYINHQVKG